MTTRMAHVQSLQHALSVLERLAGRNSENPSKVEIDNAVTNIKNAWRFLQSEEEAIRLLIHGVDED